MAWIYLSNIVCIACCVLTVFSLDGVSVADGGSAQATKIQAATPTSQVGSDKKTNRSDRKGSAVKKTGVI